MSEPRTATDEWKWRRREAIIRDDYTCQECGAQGGPEGDAQIHVHHKTPVAEGGSDELDNLKTLCDPCHRQSHAEPGDPDTVDDTGRVHDKTGTFTHKYDESTFTGAIRELGGSAGTKEIADTVGCHRDTARRRLLELVDEGDLSRRDVGDAALWQLNGERDE